MSDMVNLEQFSLAPTCHATDGSETPTLDISVVVPVYNEEGNLPELNKILHDVLGGMEMSFEIIYVDDGSTDTSLEKLRSFTENSDQVRVAVFRRNYGQTAGLAAGFKLSCGRIVVALDADLQNDPRDIPAMVQRILDGADVVSGWRKNRKDHFIRKLPSMVANKMINRLISSTGVKLHDYGCTLKAYRSEVVKGIKLYGEMHRFIPAFAAWLGVDVEEMVVNHHPRTAGVSKYGMKRIPAVMLDFILVRFFSDYMTKPSRFFGKVALLFGGLGMSLMVLLGLAGWLFGLDVNFNTFLMVALITAVLGVQSISLGLLGEMHMRSYFEHGHKDPFVIREVIQRCPPVDDTE